MSFTAYSSNAILEGDPIDHSALWVQVHTQVPGLAGTANVAGASPSRVQGSFTVVDNFLSNDAQINLASDGTGSSTLRYFTLWDDESAGNCLYTNGVISPQLTMTAGDEVGFEIGDLILELQVAEV